MLSLTGTTFSLMPGCAAGQTLKWSGTSWTCAADNDTQFSAGSGLSLTYYDSSMNAIAGPMTTTKYTQAAVVDVAIRITLSHSVFGTVSRTTRVVLRNMVS